MFIESSTGIGPEIEKVGLYGAKYEIFDRWRSDDCG